MGDANGMKYGRYVAQEMIGEGHIGRVYRALDSEIGQTVALKVLLDESPVEDAKAYFLNEIAILSRLQHPHIPRFFESFDGDPAAIALEFIDGKDADVLLAELPAGEFFSPNKIVQWGVQICDALAYLHDHNPPIAFRDLKPSHIMINAHHNAWLVDFNLAKILPPDKFIPQADLVGTEGFAAPEQYQGTVSPLVDIYGLGATLHQLITRIDPRRERPFTYAPLRAINPLLPKAFADVIMRALAYEPQDRFPNADAFKAALLACL